LQKIFSCYETQQLILGTGTAIWWVTEPHYLIRPRFQFSSSQSGLPLGCGCLKGKIIMDNFWRDFETIMSVFVSFVIK
jgi:hypothetical protein